MEEKIYLALLHTIGLNQKKLSEIFREKQNYREVYNRISTYTLKNYGCNGKQIHTILERFKKYPLSYIESKIEERKVKIITIHDREYPKEFLQTYNIPYVIYVRGALFAQSYMSIVGTRRITNYGKKALERFVPDISKYFTIVSGGAAGCDTYAHKYALESGGKTISIIGTGIDQDYPVGNKKLYTEIVEKGGAVISQFPVGEVGNPYNFPIRNELVAALGIGLFVVEAGEKSGTIITANIALDMGKDIFALPGDIFGNNSAGCNKLIQSGAAKLVTSSLSILEEYNISSKSYKKEEKELKFDNEIQKNIYNLLLLESLDINQLTKKLQLDVSEISFHISMLEITGKINKTLAGKYELN